MLFGLWMYYDTQTKSICSDHNFLVGQGEMDFVLTWILLVV